MPFTMMVSATQAATWNTITSRTLLGSVSSFLGRPSPAIVFVSLQVRITVFYPWLGGEPPTGKPLYSYFKSIPEIILRGA